jgi:hypothetical protein
MRWSDCTKTDVCDIVGFAMFMAAAALIVFAMYDTFARLAKAMESLQ